MMDEIQISRLPVSWAQNLPYDVVDTSSPDLSAPYPQLGAGIPPILAAHEGFDDRYHDISEIALENNFSHKRYQVTTDDGYILSLDRIAPYGKSVEDDFEAPVVLLQHGIDHQSIDWVLNSPDKALAFILSRAGYDVWLGNNRGNIQSRGHVSMNDR